MIVCAHGEVSEYCENRDMIIQERYTGDIENYAGVCRVLVTDQDMTPGEYYYLKGKMLGRGVELVSTRYVDTENLAQGAVKIAEEQRPGKGGRRRFGSGSETERAVVHRIFDLRDSGSTMRAISDDKLTRRADGSKLSISTIQLILKNREKYEGE